MAEIRIRLWAVLQIVLFLVFQIQAYDITGIKEGVKPSGERPARQNLVNFQSSGPAFDLYILAFTQFQDEDQGNLLSFYQIGGIHGYPFRPWDGVNGRGGAGYCAHASTVFPTWHRPYLSLYEMQIWKNAQTIATRYPENVRRTYVDAAVNLRIPYWDWANNPELPQSMITPQIEINTPQGRRSVRNPQYSFVFNPTVEKGFNRGDPLLRYPGSVRAPNAQGQSQNAEVQRRLRQNGASWRQSTYALLTSETNYTIFSTNVVPGRGNDYNNVESSHGQVHVAVGGSYGHMSYVPWSSFDPVFWLHHTNVDRIIALWQAINPDSWVRPLATRGDTFTRPAGTVEDANTPLHPFHMRGSIFWNSDTSRSTRTFGYTYPEIQDWNISKEQLQRNVRQRVNELYNRAQSLKKRSKDGSDFFKPGAFRDLASVLKKTFKIDEILKDLSETSLADFDTLGINNMKKQWVANIKVDKFAINYPFNIHFFLGEPPNDSSTWERASNLVGSFSLFSSSMPYPEGAAHIVYGQQPLTHAVAEAYSNKIIDSMDSKVVVPLLKTHLQWRVQSLDGSVIDTAKLVGSSSSGQAGLEITILERDVEPLGEGQDTDFPRFGNWKAYEDVTKDKSGGYNGGFAGRH
ncbi:hypothetical protein LOZ58_004560 [Ophidiomyces ophidiicola]|nr:hypothetical protein LOZ58_004560 [Ophidiomyces ophidiicola]